MVSAGFKTDQGRCRDNNEDSLFILPNHRIYMVADGVGGNRSGEVASRTAVTYVASYADSHPLEEVRDEEELQHYFLECVTGANDEICRMASEDWQYSGMATTLVVAYLTEEKGYVVNIGDSRAYLIRGGEILQITRDHTYVNELLMQGSISEEEAKRHPERNMITRAVGGDASVRPDFFRFDLEAGDVILLCTDGLYGEVEDEIICQMVTKEPSMHQLAADLVEQANSHGGRDNISVVCIRV
ncbi:MAG: Stp1/IreP family PP2C-type Ser/Thr phosphatase [Firmicutes bacterium]|nr:Stp1/IreP family PP2C-type Ser/Thr phosphatase [Bacillota bacterium]